MRRTRQSMRLALMLSALLSAPVMAQVSESTMLTPYGEVSISRDNFNNPNISGPSELAVSFVQGYLHADDRFFQMDFNRHAASGRVAELVGTAALESDVQLRTLGLRRAAWATWVALDDHSRAVLKAYSDGVNSWLQGNVLPPEYDILELLNADPWSPVDSLTIGKALAFQLSFDLADIDFTIRALAYRQAGQIGGFNGAALFAEDTHRSQPPDDRVSVPGFLVSIGGIQFNSDGASTSAAAGDDKSVREIELNYELGAVDPQTVAMAQRWREQIADIPLFARALDSAKQGTGSNAWAVSGDLTASGDAILANDPHLGLDNPSIFVEERLNIAGGFSAGGVGFAGIPGIVQGCNEHFCWGTTTNPLDVTDIYQEQFLTNNLGQPTHTLYQGQPERIRTVFQSYFANQVGDNEQDNLARANVGLTSGAVSLLVPRRNNGPIVQVDGNTGLSVQYAGWGPTFEIASFLAINRATNLEEFEDALQLFDVGSQNFLYADRAGSIAYFTTGEMPIRADLQDDMMPDGGIPPWLIRNGTGALNHEWLAVRNPQPQQILPYEILPWQEMPKSINPASGYLANANNDPIGTTLDNNPLNQVRPGGNGLYYLNQGYVAYRMGRIDRELESLAFRGNVTLADMAELQANHQLRDAEVLSPFIVDAILHAFSEDAWPGLAAFAQDPRLFEVGLRLGAWDYSTPTGLAEGFDPNDDAAELAEPTGVEIADSVAATIYSTWRAQLLSNTVDGVLTAIGLGDFLPEEREAWNAVTHQLVSFEDNFGVGASGIPFFNVPGAPDPYTARDVVILQSLVQALNLLASDEFAAAFGNSTELDDYRWGKLHRIVYEHPLGVPALNLPQPGYPTVGAGLPGFPRSGGYESVDAARHSSRANGVNEFMFSSGPARRFLGEMSQDGLLLQVIPGGRSGVFLSPFYGDQLPLWLTNQYHELP